MVHYVLSFGNTRRYTASYTLLVKKQDHVVRQQLECALRTLTVFPHLTQ